MKDSDKNQHLSPILSDIKDFGPAPEAEENNNEDYGSPDKIEDFYTTIEENRQEQDRQLAQDNSAPAGRQFTLLTAILLLLLAALVTAVAYLLHARINELQQQITQLQSQPPASAVFVDEHTHAEDPRVAAVLARVERLQGQLSASPGDPSAAAPDTVTATRLPVPGVAGSSPADPATVTDSLERNEGAEAASGAPSEPAVEAVSALAPWFINLSSFQTETVARRWAASLENSPRPLQIVPVDSDGRALYRVRTGGFATRAEALDWAAKLKARWQLEATWVQKQVSKP